MSSVYISCVVIYSIIIIIIVITIIILGVCKQQWYNTFYLCTFLFHPSKCMLLIYKLKFLQSAFWA